MSDSLCWLSALELAELVRTRQVSPVEIVEAVLARIDRLNPQLNAIITRADDAAREAARRIEAAVARGESVGPFAGVPITVKDLNLTADIRTTLGSRRWADFVPHEDSLIVRRLKAAGAIVVGKTNTSELGLVPLTRNALVGDAHNPWALDRNTGGSSGGAAAAVACGMGPIATGSDGGGSIRIPAAFCGVFGLKPHLGRIPHVAFPRGWESLAHQGPLSRTVRDAALLLDATAGPDPADRWSLPADGRSFVAACTGDARGLRLAWSPRLGSLPIEPDVLAVCEAAAARFAELGCTVETVQLDLPDLSPAQQVIVLCETATAMAPDRERWQRELDPLLVRMLPKADRLTFHDLVAANWAREEYWERLWPVLEKYDALLTPTAPIVAPACETLGPTEIAGQRVRALSWLGFCVPANMTWQPAASLPAGFNAEGLPVGLQVIGRRFDEWTVLRLASAYEAAFPWTERRPPIAV